MFHVMVHLGLLLILGVSLVFVDTDSQLFGVLAGAAFGIGIAILDQAVHNGKYLRLGFYAVCHPRSRIRVSVSYLYRIKVGTDYMLIRGHRFQQFQPVGGVYKILPKSTTILSKFQALDDDLVPVDPKSQHDLRLRIPSAHLIGFMRWFESGTDREVGPWREFQEELIATGILPAETFRTASSRFVARTIRPLRYSPRAAAYELLVADIFELAPTDEQEECLRRMRDAGHQEVLWATESQIRRQGAVPGKNQSVEIGAHAEWVIDA